MAGKKKMVFDYDSEKNLRNIKERGLPFDLAEFVLADPDVKLEVDNRKDYGEERLIAYGKAGELRLRLVYTLRGDELEICRIIALYQVHDKEWKKHYEKDD
jgi:uncharacterized DUF497 family protein